MNEASSERSLIVGIRDRQPGLLDFARGLADLLNVPLQVTHAYAAPYPYPYAAVFTGDTPSDELAPAARQVLDDAKSHLDATGGEHTDVAYELVHGYPPAVLGAHSHDAKALVIGTDNVHWMDRVTGASVTNFLSFHAGCPVLVIPPHIESFDVKEVVVTVDGKTPAHGPLQFAFEVADRADRPLRALHVADRSASTEEMESAHISLAEVLAGWSEAYPGVRLSSAVLRGNPAEEALEAAGQGSIIVAGRPSARRRGGWSAPVAQCLVRAGERPIAIVPAMYTV